MVCDGITNGALDNINNTAFKLLRLANWELTG